MLGMPVSYAKVGRTTFGQALGAAVANSTEFIGRTTKSVRVFDIAAEDPPEYTAFVARHLNVEPGGMTFFRHSLVLDVYGLARVVETVKAGGYGLALMSSWRSVIRGLVRDEDDSAGAVIVVERVKAATRETGIPWLVDAHSGRGEDQGDDADPTKAPRGASAAAGAVDYILSLRYADGAFGTRRRLSGRGRFVTLAPQTVDFNPRPGSTRTWAPPSRPARRSRGARSRPWAPSPPSRARSTPSGPPASPRGRWAAPSAGRFRTP